VSNPKELSRAEDEKIPLVPPLKKGEGFIIFFASDYGQLTTDIPVV
jgi:hypothetical protein